VAIETSPAQPPRSRWLRRHLLPFGVIASLVFIQLVLYGMVKTEIGIEYHFNAMLGFQFLVMASMLLLTIWFFALSGYPRTVKAVGGGFVAAFGLLIVDLMATHYLIETVEFDGEMSPTIRWSWEPKARERLAQHRAETGEGVGGADLTLRPTDSPSFRGPAGDGVAPGVTLVDWETSPPSIQWTYPVGNGHAGFAVAGNSIITLEQDADNEMVACYDRDTGKPRWFYRYQAKFAQSEPMGGTGPRTTPVIVDNDVYTLGGSGDLLCIDSKSGKPKWQVNILADNGATNLEWGMSGSPVVSGNKIIVNPGVNPAKSVNQAVAAYDRTTGKKIWAEGLSGAAYASPQVVTLSGKPQVLVFDSKGLGGYDLDTGSELWRFPWKTSMNMNSAQPVLTGPDTLFVSSELSNGGAVIRVTQENGSWKTESKWNNRKIYARFCSPLYYNDHIYGIAGGHLVCLNATTGKEAWTDGDFGDGQILRAGDKLVISDGRGKVKQVAADPAEYRELGTVDVFKDRTWNVPALAGNQLFIRNHRDMACLKLAP